VQRRPQCPRCFFANANLAGKHRVDRSDSAMHATAASRLGHLALNSLLRRNVRFHCVSDQIADIALRQPRTNSELDAPRPIEKQHHRRGCLNNPRPRQRQFVDPKVVSGSPAMPHVPVQEQPGSNLIKESPVRNAFGGHVIGSTARLRRLTLGSGSPLKSIR
jgi:hypothetical protein